MTPIDDILFLKDLKRAGWLLKNVSDPESVADHSFGTATLALFFCPESLNKSEVLSTALIHDLAESRVGDITPHSKDITQNEKLALEKKAIRQILDRKDLIQLFDDYLSQSTDTAKFVMKMDKLEMALQALRYNAQGKLSDENLKEFLTSAKKSCQKPSLKNQ